MECSGNASRLDGMLQMLGLKDKYPNKIAVNDVVAINLDDGPESGSQLEQLPWLLLRRVITVHSDAMTAIMSGLVKEDAEEDDFDLDNDFDDCSIPTDSNCFVSPLDIFICTYQCCDPLLKQLLFQKLYLCKKAVPFMHTDALTSKTIISVWPLRSLVVENGTSHASDSDSSCQMPVLEIKTKVVTFSRCGRPLFSKSKLLNGIFGDSSEISNTFYNINCPQGNTERHFSHGYIEMFCLPSTGDQRIFSETVTFLNARGRIESDFNQENVRFVSGITDIYVMATDKTTLQAEGIDIENTILEFRFVILIIASQLTNRDEAIKKRLTAIRDKMKQRDGTLTIVLTHKGANEKNFLDIVSTTRKCLSDLLPKVSVNTMNKRLSEWNGTTTKFDEDRDVCACIEGKNAAMTIISEMKRMSSLKTWKTDITPASFVHSKELGPLTRKQYKVRNASEGDGIQKKINACRLKQIESTSAVVKLFLQHLNVKDINLVRHIIRWLSILLDETTRMHVHKLQARKHSAQIELIRLKETLQQSDPQISEKEQLVNEFEEQISNASFGIEHMFREIGHVYDSVIELDKRCKELNLVSIHDTCSRVADLILDGYSLELIDGDSFYKPRKWIKRVMNALDAKIKSKKIVSISGLGLQSSGKSTLFNTLFGLSFPVSTGRCTKGLHMHLVPVKHLQNEALPFEYVMVIDSEGLRAPELADATTKSNRDNEIATFITGLGNITIINVMGENLSDVHDILQIVIHAFLRLKLANESIQIGAKCFLVHQNVTDVSAQLKLKDGMLQVVNTLDKVTVESALSEGIKKISRFNQVIEFNTESNVWYIPGFWQGSPPMTCVNRQYSERVSKFMPKLIPLKANFMSLKDIAIHAEDLWKGVLTEDFVFSFRNSLEIKAYVALEKTVHTRLWNVELSFRQTVFDQINSAMSVCRTEADVHGSEAVISTFTYETLSQKKEEERKALEKVFEENEYKTIVVQWKEKTLKRIEALCSDLKEVARLETVKAKDRKLVEIRTASVQKEHKEKLHQNSTELAKTLKGKVINQSEIGEHFETIWKKFETDIITHDHETSETLIETFRKCLIDFFENDSHILQQELNRRKGLESSSSDLKGSFQYVEINERDVDIISECPGDMNDYLTSTGDDLFENVNRVIKSICKADIELTDIHVKQLLHDVKDQIDEIEKSLTNISFKKTFHIKVYIHICGYACEVFDEQNREYVQNHGVIGHLLRYKEEVRHFYMAEINDRKVEESAAEWLCKSIEESIKRIVLKRTTDKVQNTLFVKLPSTKFVLILEMLKDLAETGDFETFMKYIKTPKQHAVVWLTERANRILFGSDSGEYFKIAISENQNSFKEIVDAVRAVKVKEDQGMSMKDWFQKFAVNAKMYNFSIESVQSFDKPLRDLECFTDSLLSYLQDTEQKLEHEIRLHTEGTVKWFDENPYTRLFEQLWGCPEQCPFCGEPCALDKNHTSKEGGQNHHCMQHRPTCCRGIRDMDSKEAATTVCNFDVQSTQIYHCKLHNFLCNLDREQNQCQAGFHLYKDYKVYLWEWDIAPSTNMYDCAKYWLWFVATYQKELVARYRYSFPKLPSSWSDITKKQAMHSLGDVYLSANT